MVNQVEEPEAFEDSDGEAEECPVREISIELMRQAFAESRGERLRCRPGRVIADSGCRAAVGGKVWHQAHQKLLREAGLTWTEEPQVESYRFGSGPVQCSERICVPSAGRRNKGQH